MIVNFTPSAPEHNDDLYLQDTSYSTSIPSSCVFWLRYQRPSSYSSTSYILATESPHISLQIGTGRTNVGSNPEHQIEHNIIQALKSACPHPGDQKCGPGMEGKFGVQAREKNKKEEYAIKYVDMMVKVESAQWHGNKEIYNLLIKAVAGAAERGTWNRAPCYSFSAKDKKGMKQLEFCNTANRIAVSFPKHNYMNVSLSSPTSDGVFDCWSIRDTMAHHLRELEPEIERAVGIESKAVYHECGA
jgi:hypothetical protein